jgi:hypothetical protein
MNRTWIMLATMVLTLAAGKSAMALTVNGSGTIQDGWNVTPFSTNAAPAQANLAGGVTAYYQNNWSPINYPGIGHVPSPGGSTGEKFDLEEMYIRKAGTVVQMLLVASSGYTATSGGTTYDLGDVLLDFNHDGTYDAGVVSQHGNAGLTAGGLYTSITTAGLQNLPGSYYGTSTATAIGPWAVKTGTLDGTIANDQTTFNYGGSEGNTYLTVFSFDLAKVPGTAPTSFDFHLDWGCGNDVIDGTYTIPSNPTGPAPGVPEPMTMGLSGLGLGALVLTGLRRRGR